MIGARAAQTIKDNDAIAPEFSHSRNYAVKTGLIHSPGNLKSLPTKLNHFRHKGHLVQCSFGVQGLKDFAWSQDLHEVA
jgi:hypothetical protein